MMSVSYDDGGPPTDDDNADNDDGVRITYVVDHVFHFKKLG